MSFEEFKKALGVSVDALKKKLGSQKFAVIIDKGKDPKSSEWVLSLIRDQLKDAKYAVVYNSDLSTFLKENSDVSNFVRIDDAVYSGEQVVSFYRELSKANDLMNRPVHLHIAIPYQTTVGRMYIEDFAKKPNLSNVSISLEPEVVKMDTLEEKVKLNPTLFPDKFLESMFKMFPNVGNGGVPSLERTKKVTNIFFQHKVPDGASAIDALLRNG